MPSDEMVERGAKVVPASRGCTCDAFTPDWKACPLCCGVAEDVLTAALVITPGLVEKVAKAMCVNPDDCWPFWKDSAFVALRAAGFREGLEMATTEYPPEGHNVECDTWEAEVHDGSEVSTTREVCDHADWTSNSYSEDIYVDMGYCYCPKCGEKLQ